MWRIYDELIEGIPDDILVEDYLSEEHWTMIQAGGNAGLAMSVHVDTMERVHKGNIVGKSLKKIASLSMSWNLLEAATGVAAINAYYNTPKKMNSLIPVEGKEFLDSAFDAYIKSMMGKNVAVVGHFPYIEKELGPVCNLSILERNPSKGDYPDSACEFILPDQDYVFITGSTFVNKTLPRLLQITSKNKNTKVILVGPSVTLTPLMYKYGVSALSGFYIKDVDRIKEILRKNTESSIFGAGDKVNFIDN